MLNLMKPLKQRRKMIFHLDVHDFAFGMKGLFNDDDDDDADDRTDDEEVVQ
jgi:hypothetical protein